ncbi:hypothetical protein PPERSA_07424 [Pseudocohnilembus persalinus]|uniref:Transmembrane protein n=1 Tax=Pseudocohnilembus persalinus TaxID=266149 RepID=A0A0V0QAB6_PSEPJ|nr:hypothetical protein PPERSA_07424 [Pseudocohnilembus persalinus]|eukprot:KRW99181.1 hypothetical protein PPERSA_07424 [Pseudocohnilembus persalinus]
MLIIYLGAGIIIGLIAITFMHGKPDPFKEDKQKSDSDIKNDEKSDKQKTETKIVKNKQNSSQNQSQVKKRNINQTENKKVKEQNEQKQDEVQLTEEQKSFLKKKEEENLASQKASQERQERILSKLSPSERKLMQEFFAKNQGQEKKLQLRFFFIEAFMIFTAVMVCYALWLLLSEDAYKPAEIYQIIIQLVQGKIPLEFDGNYRMKQRMIQNTLNQ